MSNLICSKCMEVLESKDGKCPTCHSGHPYTYEFKNSDEYLKKEIKRVIEMRKESGLEGLVGSEDEGLKQAFSVESAYTLLVNVYIHRFGDFDGFFTKRNVTSLTEATGKQ